MPDRISTLVLLALTMAPTLLASAPRQGAPGESFLAFLAAAYAVTWVAFFAYSFYISRKQAELRRELGALRQALEQRERAGPTPQGSSSEE
jgi:CcmD family protein